MSAKAGLLHLNTCCSLFVPPYATASCCRSEQDGVAAGELTRLEAIEEAAWLLGHHMRIELCRGHMCDVHALYAAHIQPALTERLYLQGRSQRCV